MITQQQRIWLSQLSDTKLVEILPYDKKAPEKFRKLKTRLRGVLGNQYNVLLKGAAGLGISGKGELDIFVPVSPDLFDITVNLVKQLLGPPESHYQSERARFNTVIDGTEAEVFVINDETEGWRNGLKFENYLLNNPKYLEQYRCLKEAAQTTSVREYYRHKIEFINEILMLAGQRDISTSQLAPGKGSGYDTENE